VWEVELPELMVGWQLDSGYRDGPQGLRGTAEEAVGKQVIQLSEKDPDVPYKSQVAREEARIYPLFPNK
jgi:hypothetical protein